MHRINARCCIIAILGSAAFAFTSATHAQAWRFTINPKSGGLTDNLSLSAPIPGTVIGNYDATSNPGGTQTRPGLFGGSGNNPITFSITLSASDQSTLHPTGAFRLNLDIGNGAAGVQDFAADLLPDSPLSLALTLQLLYQSFHTVAPTAIFPGGTPIPLPLGQITISALTLQQSAALSLGTLTPAQPGHYSVNIATIADLTVQASGFGQNFTFGPLPVPLLLAGDLQISGGSATLTLTPSIALDQTFPGPFPGGTFTDVPLDVPTILPPGSTAHLLFNGELASLALTFNVGGTASAAGTRLGDADHNGMVNVNDLLEVITHWGACRGGACAADLNGDGIVSALDLMEVLDNWG